MSVALRLDFTLQQGAFLVDVHERVDAQVIALFGPSGAGKTTTLEVLAGLRRPDHGELEVGARVLYSSSRHVDLPPRRRGIGYVPQDAALFPHMDVRHNITYGASRGRRIALDRLLDLLEIQPLIDRTVAALSGGERQRVALARALMSSPDLLLLDEPLAGVDLPLRRRIVPYLLRVRDEIGVPMIYVTHDTDEVSLVADWAIVLSRGVVVGAGPPAAVLES